MGRRSDFRSLSVRARGGSHKAVGLGERGANKAPGRLGRVRSKPFRGANKAIGKSDSAGRRGRGKLPL